MPGQAARRGHVVCVVHPSMDTEDKTRTTDSPRDGLPADARARLAMLSAMQARCADSPAESNQAKRMTD
jgi:hypothetical protein